MPHTPHMCSYSGHCMTYRKNNYAPHPPPDAQEKKQQCLFSKHEQCLQYLLHLLFLGSCCLLQYPVTCMDSPPNENNVHGAMEDGSLPPPPTRAAYLQVTTLDTHTKFIHSHNNQMMLQNQRCMEPRQPGSIGELLPADPDKLFTTNASIEKDEPIYCTDPNENY